MFNVVVIGFLKAVTCVSREQASAAAPSWGQQRRLHLRCALSPSAEACKEL